jgi:hypothetical protein
MLNYKFALKLIKEVPKKSFFFFSSSLESRSSPTLPSQSNPKNKSKNEEVKRSR